MRAAWLGRTDVVVELVKGGANLDLQNKVCIVMNTGYPRCSAIVIVATYVLNKYGVLFAKKEYS